MTDYNIGEVLFQLINLGLIVLIIFLIASFFRSHKDHKTQLDRIEKKIDVMKGQFDKGKD